MEQLNEMRMAGLLVHDFVTANWGDKKEGKAAIIAASTIAFPAGDSPAWIVEKGCLAVQYSKQLLEKLQEERETHPLRTTILSRLMAELTTKTLEFEKAAGLIEEQ